MNLVRARFVFVALALSLISLLAQAQKDVAAPASGALPPLAHLSEKERGNVAEFNITAGPTFDNGAIDVRGNRISDTRYSLMPSLALTRKSARSLWNVDYEPGVLISQRGLYTNQFSQIFGGQLEWLPTKRINFSLRQDYLRVTDPFTHSGAIFEPSINAANQSLLIPNYRRTQILSSAQSSYLVGEHTTLSATVQFGDHQYSNESNAPATPLLHTQIDAGEFFLSHQVSRSQSVGLQYETQNIKIFHANAGTLTHSAIFFAQYSFTPQATLYVYGGPSYSITQNQVELDFVGAIFTIPVNNNSWSPIGGTVFSWEGHRSSFDMQFSRRVTDGEGLFGTVYMNSGSSQFSRKLTPRWEAFMRIQGSVSDLIGVSGADTELRSYGGSTGLKRRLSQQLAINLYYGRVNQSGGLGGQMLLHNHDLVGLSLEYKVQRPLGR
jgi:hypothetical protein